MAQLDKTFPTNDCSMCIMSPKLVDAGRHRNIEILTNAKVAKVEGEPGNFKVLIHKKARYVTIEDCKACGDCTKVCPVKIPNDYEQGLVTRAAVYQLFAQAMPSAYGVREEGNPLPAGLPVPSMSMPRGMSPLSPSVNSRKPSPSSGRNFLSRNSCLCLFPSL